MSGNLNHTPAQIVRKLLIDLGVVSDVADHTMWPCYTGLMPEKPSESVCIYDTDGKKEGRVQIDGESQIKEGFNVRVRSDDLTRSYLKAKEIINAFDSVLRRTVQLGDQAYFVQAISRTGSIMYLGTETPTSKRRLHSANAIVSIRMLESDEVGTGS